MTILFPCHPLRRRLPDPDYESEAEAAEKAGFGCAFYNLDALRANDIDGALAACPSSALPGQIILHRGWMMSDSLYDQLHKRLVGMEYAPVTNPEQYTEAHYLPDSYKHIAEFTPESRWIAGADLDEAWTLYQYFRNAPALIKDYVKSAKHKWSEACFIPAQTSREKLEQIIKALLEDRGDQFNKGLVFRRFHPLVTIEQTNYGQPVHEEYRLFFFHGELLAATPGQRGDGLLQIDKWAAVARRFQNPFISMDIARQEDGSWIIIEVGDGGVSGLPPSIEAQTFYARLWERMLKLTSP